MLMVENGDARYSKGIMIFTGDKWEDSNGAVIFPI